MANFNGAMGLQEFAAMIKPQWEQVNAQAMAA